MNKLWDKFLLGLSCCAFMLAEGTDHHIAIGCHMLRYLSNKTKLYRCIPFSYCVQLTLHFQ